MATLLTPIDEETYSPSNQESDESPQKRANQAQPKQTQPLPHVQEEEEIFSESQSHGQEEVHYE